MNLSQTQSRICIYIACAVVLVVGSITLRGSMWTGSTELHTLMEVMATTLAFFVGVMSLLNYYTNRSSVFLFIGVGFLGAGFLDGYHALVTSVWFAQSFPAPPPSLLPWSWLASRIFLSMSMFLSWLFWVREEVNGNRPSDVAVYAGFTLFTIASFVFFAFAPLPRAYYPELFFGRPEDLVPALFFLMALVGYVMKNRWREDVFEHWVVLSLIVAFVSQVMFMSFSDSLFDIEFDMAHLLKKVGYVLVLIGLLVSMYQIFVRERTTSIRLQKQTKKLKRETKKKEKALTSLVEEQKNLAESKAKDEAILRSLGDGLVVTDRKGRIVLVNPAFERLLGWKQSEVLGKKLIDTIPMFKEEGVLVEEKERLFSKALHAKNATITQSATYFYETKDGKQLPVYISVSPVSLGGDVIGAVEVFRDITKEKEVDRAKTEFVSLASHQLRTPLTSVNWYAEILLAEDAGNLNDVQKDYLSEIYQGNKRMVALVDALLNVSRLDMGTFVASPEKFDMKKLAQRIVADVKPLAKERKQKIEEHYGDTIGDAVLDKKLIDIILQNLLSNAVKYTPEKGNVTISVERKNNMFDIRVADTGMGIPKESQDKIFTKLYRADNVRETDTVGTGLGLYMVQSIVQQIGGTIRFESEANKGTTFFVTLPTGE